MRPIEQPRWHHNQYNADSACEHCRGIIRHERWCITRNAAVRYAYEIILDPDKLSPCDQLTLHALGISWCDGNCGR